MPFRNCVLSIGLPSGPSMLGNAGLGLGSTAAGGAAVGASFTAGATMGAAVAAKAQTYLGVPYKWGGETPAGWDCSGFVTYVLHHDSGIDLPSNVHTIAAQFYAWSGARSIPRAQCRAGDLVCWVSHIGIATGPNTMINAPKPGTATQIDQIWSAPPALIRRPIAYGG